MKKLHLAEGLSFPLDAVTQAIGILAKRRAGKSFAARRLAEQLVSGGQQVVIVDPKGDWWGIRSAANGKDPGLPIVILGGERHDVKLEPSAGEVVAKLVVEERVSVLLDLSLLRKHEVATFMAIFLEQLYRLKAREEFREPLMLIVDEADAIAPQKPQKGEERMLGAAEDIVRRGGQRGIGCTLVTQRSAVLNKNVLTQIQILIALRTIAPQDLTALNAWIDVHGTDEERQTLMESLPSLPVGDAWVWSPGWPTDTGIFQRIHVLPIETFDSGATPKPGEKRREPKALAAVDLDALKRQMAETIERAKAEDPRELRKTIAQLRAELAQAQKAKPAPVPPAKAPRVVEKPVLKDEQVKRLETQAGRLISAVVALQSVAHDLDTRANEIKAALAAARDNKREGAAVGGSRPGVPAAAPHSSPGRGIAALIPDGPATPARSRAARPGQWGEAKDRIVAVLAMRGPQTRPALGTYALMAHTGGTFKTYVPQLLRDGYIEADGALLRVTDAGRATLPKPARDVAPATGEDLRDAWRENLRAGGMQAIFDALVTAYPSSITRADLAGRAGMSADGGTFKTYFPKLARLGLVEAMQDRTVKATDELFAEIAG